jgi:hypothetical protein
MTYRNNCLVTSTYGCIETNGLNGGPNVEERPAQPGMPAKDSVKWHDDGRPAWAQPAFKRFVRVRLLSDPGFPFWDVSYAFGEWIDGSIARIHEIPGEFGCCQLKRRSWKSDAIREAQRWGVFLKAKGFFDAISTLI